MCRMDQEKWLAAVADTIRAERAAAKLSQAELAARSGIPRVTFIRYETGDRRPNVVQLAQIAEGLRMPFSTLVRRMEERAGI